MSFNQSENRLVTCPYDEAHKLKASRLQLHIAKCKLNHLDKVKELCPFNATHLFTPSERDFHLMNCPDRAPLDRSVSQNALDKNNPFKGRTAVPSFSEPLNVHEEEVWDEVLTDGFVPSEPPPGAIIEPQPMSKPAERRQLYSELHRQPIETDNDRTASVSKPSPVPRQPKQPSETQKLQNVSQMSNTQAIQNLGLGRGRSTRIAASIFDNANGAVMRTNQPSYSNVVSNQPSYSNIVKDMSNLGLGRGQAVSQSSVPQFRDDDDDEDFPALGCGRGVLHARKQNPRTPGGNPKK